MKLASYFTENRQSFGVVHCAEIVDVPTSWPGGPSTLLEALEAGPGALSHLRDLAPCSSGALRLDDVRLLAPIARPPKVIGLAVNYAAHHRELDRPQGLPDDPRTHTTPRPFLMPGTAILGPDDTIPWPAFSREVDYEVELAVIIGAKAHRIAPQDAPACIAGYTIANDISARSVTHSRGRTDRPKDAFFDWLHGKWSDGFCPTGPLLVTPDEVGDPMDLDISLKVNGLPRQDANTSQMIFPVCELVSFLSQLMTLEPGDLIATGTPSGVGAADGRFLEAGDVLSCRIEKLGELTNTLGAPPESFYEPCADGNTPTA
jgi:2-keto-4-pentenoate hydratase/2-oxohepta-3-ene-1,7-dioic acid hydratase in catechol pathway